MIFIYSYPRRACAARVTVLGYGSVCVCVCVCLLSHISPTDRLFVLKTLSRTQRATKVKKFVRICLKRLRSRVMPRNMSEKANNMLIVFRKARSPYQRCMASFLAQTAKISSKLRNDSHFRRCGFITCKHKSITIPCNLGLFLSSNLIVHTK